MRTRIKICGIRTIEHARCAIEAGADALGFVFASESPRFIEPADAWEIVNQMPPMVTTVGLTVDCSVEEYQSIVEVCPTDFGQLHGRESTMVARQCGPRVIKAIQFNAKMIEKNLRAWSEVEEVDAILVDGGKGGEGISLDWERLAQAKEACDKPLILAGGLDASNVARAIEIVRPYAVDVSSGVESERGVKDESQIRAFCEAVLASV
ncbi:MAG: phosphoribosylanthranilate isomerase [Planctomycetota bacterium]|jgi:phosphoribosylanthranilate isomerase